VLKSASRRMERPLDRPIDIGRHRRIANWSRSNSSPSRGVAHRASIVKIPALGQTPVTAAVTMGRRKLRKPTRCRQATRRKRPSGSAGCPERPRQFADVAKRRCQAQCSLRGLRRPAVLSKPTTRRDAYTGRNSSHAPRGGCSGRTLLRCGSYVGYRTEPKNSRLLECRRCGPRTPLKSTP
jgi:hypothetical protein